MLHMFKNLLIIGKPLDIGGSDFDTLRSTLAVSDPSTSGMVGDLAHASTSSASNQEQNPLEEFGVSTDSGTCSRFILTSC